MVDQLNIAAIESYELWLYFTDEQGDPDDL